MKLKIDLGIENLPPSQRRLLTVLPSIIIAAVFIYFFIMPLYEERSKLASEVERQENDIMIAEKQSAKLSALKAENERLLKRLKELQSMLPEEKEVSGLLRKTSELGIKSGLHVVLWKPKERIVHESKEVYQIPVEVEMRGSYHRLGHFFSNLTRLERIVNIPNLIMKPAEEKFQQKGTHVLNIGFTAVTYSIITEQERMEIEKKEKEKDKSADKEKKK